MLSDLWKSQKRVALMKNIAVMVSGNGLALVIPFILAPFLTRLYTPEDFAGYELFVRFLLPLVAIASLRYEYAIILPREDAEADAMMKLALRILIVVTIGAAIIFIPFRNFWGGLANNESLPALLWWLPMGLFFSGFLVILNNFMLRQNMFRNISANKIWATSSNHGSKYLLGLKFANASGLVWGHIIGAVAPVLTLLGKKTIYKQLGVVSRNKMPLMPLMRKYREFPLINAPHAFYDEANRAVLFLVISAFFGEITLGLFALTMRYLKVPVQVFGASLSQVFMPELAKDFSENKEIKTRIKKIMQGNAAVGILPFAVLFFFGQEIFSFVFGSTWAGAGRFAEIIAPWLYLNFITSPVSMLPTIVRRQHTFFLIVIIATLLALTLVGGLAYFDQPFTNVVVALSVVMGAMDVFLIFWFLSIARRTFTDIPN